MRRLSLLIVGGLLLGWRGGWGTGAEPDAPGGHPGTVVARSTTILETLPGPGASAPLDGGPDLVPTDAEDSREKEPAARPHNTKSHRKPSSAHKASQAPAPDSREPETGPVLNAPEKPAPPERSSEATSAPHHIEVEIRTLTVTKPAAKGGEPVPAAVPEQLPMPAPCPPATESADGQKPVVATEPAPGPTVPVPALVSPPPAPVGPAAAAALPVDGNGAGVAPPSPAAALSSTAGHDPLTGEPGPADPRIRLCVAREHFYAGQLEEARQTALQLKALRTVDWSRCNDSPDRLLADITAIDARNGRQRSAQLLAEAHHKYAQGKLDEAEELAQQAAQQHGPYSFWDRMGDCPEKLLRDIAAARHKASSRPAGAWKPPEPVSLAPARPTISASASPGIPAAAQPNRLPGASGVPAVALLAPASGQAAAGARPVDHLPEVVPVSGSASAPAPAILPAVATATIPPGPELLPATLPAALPPAPPASPIPTPPVSGLITLSASPLAAVTATASLSLQPPAPVVCTDAVPTTPAPSASPVPAPLTVCEAPLPAGTALPSASPAMASMAAGVSSAPPSAGTALPAAPPAPSPVTVAAPPAPETAPLPAPTPLAAAPAAPAPPAAVYPFADPVAHGHGIVPGTPGNCAAAGSVAGQPFCSCESDGGYLVAGAGLYLLKPFFTSNPAFTFSHSHTTTQVTTGVSTALSETVTQTQQFHEDLAAAPRIWLGWVGDEGLGVRVSWWQFQQGARVLTSNAPPDSGTRTIEPALKLLDSSANSFVAVGAGSTRGTEPLTGTAFLGQDAFAFESNLRLYVWDFDVTQQVMVGPWSLLLGGGIRYVHLSENYNAYRQSSGTSVVAAPFFATGFPQSTDALLSGHDFDGAGPTTVLEARRPLGKSGLVLYGNVRAAALFGSSRQQISELSQSTGVLTNTTRGALSPTNGSVTVMVPAGGSVTFNNSVGNSTANNQHFALLPIAECELGLEWAGSVAGLGTFARVGLVGQTYFGAGNASSQGGDLGFLGLSLMTGVDF